MANEGGTKPTYEELERELYGTEDNAVWGKQKWMDNAKYWHESYERMVYWRDLAETNAKSAEAELARVRGLLQRLEWAGTFDGDDCCPICGEYKPFVHYPDCELMLAISQTMPQGAESADIGKLDTADEKCAYCKHTHTFQFDDTIDDDCPVVGCPCMHFLGSAETGGEKAASSTTLLRCSTHLYNLRPMGCDECEALAESSLSSPPPKFDLSAPTFPEPQSTQLDTHSEKE